MQTLIYAFECFIIVFAKSAKGDFKLSEQDKKVAISLRNLTRNFRDFTAVSDLSLDLFLIYHLICLMEK